MKCECRGWGECAHSGAASCPEPVTMTLSQFNGGGPGVSVCRKCAPAYLNDGTMDYYVIRGENPEDGEP